MTDTTTRATPGGLDGFLLRWSAARGGLDPRASRWVLGWLRGVHALARPLAARRVPPWSLTALAVACTVGAAATALVGGHWLLLGALLVVGSAVADGLDGAVAVLTDTATAWGRVLDPLADRVGDLVLLLALVLAGGPGAVAVAVGALTLLLESVRSGAQAAGMTGAGAITVWERPSRLCVAGFGLLGAGVTPGPLAPTVALGIGGLLAVGGTVHLVVVVRRRLRAGAS